MAILLKLLFSRFLTAASEFAAFCEKHWRIILPCLMVGLTYLYVLSLQGQRDDWHKKFDDLVALNKSKATQRERENAKKEQTAQRNIDSMMANHLATILQLRNDYAKLKNEKTAIASQNGDLQRDINNWRQRVRLELANQRAAGLSGIPEPAGESAESGGDSHATVARSAYDTLDLACSVTTADYNALWNAWHAACLTYGCH